jgi:two-component system, OmpR family, sensor histidine kinase KdpD
MAVRKRLRPSGTAAEAARAAGIRPGDSPVTLTEVDRRRTQLWTTTLFVIVALVAVVALYWLAYDVLPQQMQLQSFSSYVLAVLIVGLLVAFIVYLVEKERRLRALSSLLVEERVLSAALSSRLSEVTALVDLGKAMNSTLDISDVLDLILSSALDMLEGTEGSIMLLEDDGEHLKVVSYKGPVDGTVITGRGKVGVGIAGTVAADREPMLIQGDRIGRGLQGHPERGISSSMCVPLVRNDELLGVLNLNKTHGQREFSEQDLHGLGLFAQHAAIAVGNARIFEKDRQTIERLEELDQLKSDFVAAISHELKTPLTAIIGAAKRISRKGADMDPAQRVELVEMIERQGNRLLRLVQDVLTTSQIESGRVMKRVLVDLRTAAEEVVQELREAKVGTDREVNLTIEPEHPQIWGDIIALQQVMANLIENALKYSESGPVDVIVKETPDEGFIQVSDKGAGISEAQLRDIFERFHQVDSSSTRRVGGFGLGLFIVKQLVDGHGGTIDVESTLGVGTTFTVHLPKRSSDRGRFNTEPDPGLPR